jgi:DNA-binding protein WhiA
VKRQTSIKPCLPPSSEPIADSIRAQRITNASRSIAYLKKRGAFETLPAPLREAAALREQNPDLSLKELAGLVRPPLSKSGLSHRMKKLEQTAESLKERTRNG